MIFSPCSSVIPQAGQADKSKIGLTPVRYAHLRRRDHRVRQNLESLGIAGLPLRSLRLCVNPVVRFSGLGFRLVSHQKRTRSQFTGAK